AIDARGESAALTRDLRAERSLRLGEFALRGIERVLCQRLAVRPLEILLRALISEHLSGLEPAADALPLHLELAIEQAIVVHGPVDAHMIAAAHDLVAVEIGCRDPEGSDMQRELRIDHVRLALVGVEHELAAVARSQIRGSAEVLDAARRQRMATFDEVVEHVSLGAERTLDDLDCDRMGQWCPGSGGIDTPHHEQSLGPRDRRPHAVEHGNAKTIVAALAN